MATADKNTPKAPDIDAPQDFGTDAELSARAENDLMNLLRIGRYPAYRTLRCLGVTIGVRVRGEKA